MKPTTLTTHCPRCQRDIELETKLDGELAEAMQRLAKFVICNDCFDALGWSAFAPPANRSDVDRPNVRQEVPAPYRDD
jgi:hypothetical protein